MDPVWLGRVESDNARISCRISASRSGDFGDMLINVTDAADPRFCLLFAFFADESRERVFSDGSFPIPWVSDVCAIEGKLSAA